MTLFFVGDRFTGAQDDSTNIRVNVDLVQLNVAVTDSKGNYISGLGPENFAITEDKIPERIATFEEGNEPARQVLQPGRSCSRQTGRARHAIGRENKFAGSGREDCRQEPSRRTVGEDVADPALADSGANVFVLFDTSNYMYRGFVFAQDAITRFCSLLRGGEQGGLLFLQSRSFPQFGAYLRSVAGAARGA